MDLECSLIHKNARLGAAASVVQPGVQVFPTALPFPHFFGSRFRPRCVFRIESSGGEPKIAPPSSACLQHVDTFITHLSFQRRTCKLKRKGFAVLALRCGWEPSSCIRPLLSCDPRHGQKTIPVYQNCVFGPRCISPIHSLEPEVRIDFIAALSVVDIAALPHLTCSVTEKAPARVHFNAYALGNA